MLEFMNVDIYKEDHLRKVNASKVNALVKEARTIAQPWCHSRFSPCGVRLPYGTGEERNT